MTIDELDREGVPALERWGTTTTCPDAARTTPDGALHAWWHPLVPPRRTVPWSGMVLLALLLAHPLALMGVLDGPMMTRLQIAGAMSLLLQNVGVLGAAIVLKYAWRISRNPASGWISAVLSLVAIQNLPFSLLAVTGSPYGELRQGQRTEHDRGERRRRRAAGAGGLRSRHPRAQPAADRHPGRAASSLPGGWPWSRTTSTRPCAWGRWRRRCSSTWRCAGHRAWSWSHSCA